jgi:hypothetical protein
MQMEADDAAKAEALSRRRARMLPVLAVLFVGQQASYFTGGGSAADASPGGVHIAAWFVLSIVILLALVTGGGWIYSRNVRRLANDEGTRAHRDRAFRVGFISSMMACMILYVVTLFRPLSGRDAVHAVLTVGILVTLLCFAFLERRAELGD